jgi:hypothetical protein
MQITDITIRPSNEHLVRTYVDIVFEKVGTSITRENFAVKFRLRCQFGRDSLVNKIDP